MKGHQTVSLPVALTSAIVGAFLVGLVAGEVSRPADEPEEPFAAVANSPARPVAPAPHEAAGATRTDAPPPHAAAMEPRIVPFIAPRLPIAARPPAPVPEPAPAAVAPPQAAPAKENPLDRLTVIHTLPVRIDLRSGDDLERELLLVPELDLDSGPTPYLADQLFTTARANQRAGQPPPSIVMACKLRSDLAGLPFRVGVEAVLPEERAKEMHNRSRYLRGTYQSLITPRSGLPTAAQLFSVLTDEQRKWAGEESVPCIQQILLAEDQPTRRMACEMLGELRTDDATAALVRIAVFDTEPANRAAAVDALRGRDQAQVVALVLPYLRFPWSHAVEHACEALINLKATIAVPALAVAYDLPDPDVPFRIGLLGEVGGSFRRELVRVNHARNCVMCHTPSLHRSDPLRAVAPVKSAPLPPRLTMDYYHGQGLMLTQPRTPPKPPTFVSATTTYLRQDFSLDQPVANPGPWPARQRYDYFLRYSPGAGGPTLRKPEESPYRRAIGLAIRHLSGHDPDRDKDWLKDQKAKAPVIEDLAGAIARVMLLTGYPDALLAVTHRDVADKLMKGKPKEVEDAVEWLQKAHGATAARLALIAYLDPLTRSPVEPVATRAGRLLTIARNPFPDATLAKAMKDALGD